MALGITSIYPTSGPTTGGQTVTITGTDLNTVTTVTIGGTAVTSIELINAFQLRAVTPAHTAGAASAVVIGDGSTTQTLAASYTYAASSSSETLTSTLARDKRVDVNTGTTEAPVWTQVRAVTTMQETITPTMQDDSDYDSNGWGSSAKTMLAWGLTMTVARKIGVESGNYDPGQEKIRAAHDKFGADGVVQIRSYNRDGSGPGKQGYAHVGWEPQGGGPDALETVNVTLTGQGERVEIPNPAA